MMENTFLIKYSNGSFVARIVHPYDRSQSAQVASLKPDNFEPKIIKKASDYLYAEYQSPTFGFIDDVEFFFTGNNRVEYRSASRIGESDGNINRKRIKMLRQVRSCFAC